MSVNVQKRPQSRSLIVKSNVLVNAEYRLTVTQMRIIYMMAMQVSPEDEDFKTYYLRTKDFQEELGISGNSLHERMVDIVKDMIQNAIQIRDEENNVDQFPPIIRSQHKSKNGIIALQFHPELRGHMIQLKENFTSFYDHHVLSLRSFNSMRIYELIKQYEKIGRRVIDVIDLRKMLQLENKYRSYNMFKKKVILKAQDDTRKYCDITFDFNEIKKSRKVEKIEFIIKKKRETITYLDKNDVSNNHIKGELLEMGLTEAQVKKYVDVDKKDPEYLRDLIKMTQERYADGKVKNPAAYLVQLIKTDAKTHSQFQKKNDELKAERVQDYHLREQKAQKDQHIITELRTEYETHLKTIQQERLASAEEKDWLAFEEAYKDTPYIAKKIFKDGVLKRDSEETLDWFKNFLYPFSDENFMNWAKEKGTSLKRDDQKESKFAIA